MMKRLPRDGFTLIELVLVLAIAGLILVIVFLAVAGAQRSRQDSGRRDAVNRTVAEYDQLTADGVNPITLAAIKAAVGALPDGVTGFTTASICFVGPLSYSDSARVAIDTTHNTACIRLDDGTTYVKALF